MFQLRRFTSFNSNLLFPSLINSVLCKSGYETSQYLLTDPQMTVYWFLCLDNKQEQSFVWEFLWLSFHLYKTSNEINILCRMVITHCNHKATFLLEHKRERDAIVCIMRQAVSVPIIAFDITSNVLCNDFSGGLWNTWLHSRSTPGLWKTNWTSQSCN